MAGETYMRLLRAHPLRTKAVTSGVLVGCSDAIAQRISGAKTLQLRRLLLIMIATDRAMSEVVAMAGEAYMRQLRAHPLRTKAVTSGVLAGCSDVVAQKLAGAKTLQLRRLLLIMLYGFAYAGPFGHFFHKLMDGIFKGKKGKETTAKKVIVEQLAASPLNNLVFMMFYGLVVEGRPFGQVKSKVKKDYANIQLTSWKFRPIVSWINYEYVPLQHRVLFASSVASCWSGP